MERFLLFGYEIRSLGGMQDFLGDFATLEGAKRFLDFGKFSTLSNGHIFDTKTKRIVAIGDERKGWESSNIPLSKLR